jgi:hypothetical protein
MAEIGKSTRIVNKASAHVLAALERAKGSLADIPLGVENLDPRTVKKRATEMPPGMETTLTRLLYQQQNDTNGGQ